ncbi:hypothetical protein JW859_14240 [bacterium]|nr:hypothetical protein [bacterium]
MSKTFRFAALLACALLLLVAASAADDLYEFGFKYGKYSISMPTAEDPYVEEYDDMEGGEFSWRIDDGGSIEALYGMCHTTYEDDWYYNYENCAEIERDPFRTIKINDDYWKYCVADVVTNKDERELTYVDLWLTRKALKHDLRFCCERFEDHEKLLKIIKQHMKTLEWWN